MALVLCSIGVSLAELLLSLFTCERGIRHARGVRVANMALRWTTMGLVSVMLLELAARTLLVGFCRYMREPLHVLDACVLVTVLVITVAVTDRQADEAVALLVAIRLIRLAKLLGGMGTLASEHAAHEVDAMKRRVSELEDDARRRGSLGV